jgi:hypothetical protein
MLGIVLGANGGLIGSWLADAVHAGQGKDRIGYLVLGMLGATVLGVAGGVYASGRVLGQRGAWWAALLGSLLGTVLGSGVTAVLGPLDLPFFISGGFIGGGALMLALIGYHRTWRFPPGAWWAVLLGGLLGAVLGYSAVAVLGSLSW